MDFSSGVWALGASDRTVARHRRRKIDRSLAKGIPGSSRRSACRAPANPPLSHMGHRMLSLPVDLHRVVRTEGRSTAVGSHAQR
jgi:hypothetical protein